MSESAAVKILPDESVKAGVIAMLQRLPDDVTYEEILEAIDVRREIEQRLAEADNNPDAFLTHEEVKQRVAKWLE